jgi:hypothetical protein
MITLENAVEFRFGPQEDVLILLEVFMIFVALHE